MCIKEKKLYDISPIDGRYRDKVDSISKYFSEKALIYYRLKVEIEYFLFLCKNRIGKLKPLNSKKTKILRNIYNDFSMKDAIEIKKIEKKTNHDVKAVEYFIKKKFDQNKLGGVFKTVFGTKGGKNTITKDDWFCTLVLYSTS